MITKSITLESDSHTLSIAIYDDGLVSVLLGEKDMEMPLYVSVDKQETISFLKKALELLGE